MTEREASPSTTDPNPGEGADGDVFAGKLRTDHSRYSQALQTWMTKAFPERENFTVTDIEVPVATGFSNMTIMFDGSWTRDGHDYSQRYVARIEPQDGGMFPPQTPDCQVSVEVQYRAMKAVAAARVAPMPQLYGYEPDAAVLGAPFFVMEFVEGRIASDVPRFSEAGFMKEEATPEERSRAALSAIEIIASINTIDWRSAGLGWLDPSGIGEPTMATQFDLYRELVTSELAGRRHDVFWAGLEWLEANDPGDDRIGFTWGDARLGNMILRDYRPVAVLDWEVCSLIPTEADIGWWLMFDRMSFDYLGIDRLEGYPTRAEMIKHYKECSGLTVLNPHYWEVFATLRFCAIFIRLGDRLTAAGFVPPERNPAVGNYVTDCLAQLLGIENPTEDLLIF